MDRRQFLLTSVATASVAALGRTAEAATDATLPPQNIIFTEGNGGVWAAKKGSHLPKIEVADGKVTVSTDHGHSEEHYIVRHTLLLSDGTVLGATTFSPKDSPVSAYELPAGYKGQIYATSFCNKHDLWLSSASVG